MGKPKVLLGGGHSPERTVPKLAGYLCRGLLERLPAITDATTVGEIIEASGLPIYEPVIEFHCKYVGFVQPYDRVKFIWGLFHEFPHDYSFFKPNQPHCNQNLQVISGNENT